MKRQGQSATETRSGVKRKDQARLTNTPTENALDLPPPGSVSDLPQTLLILFALWTLGPWALDVMINSIHPHIA